MMKQEPHDFSRVRFRLSFKESEENHINIKKIKNNLKEYNTKHSKLHFILCNIKEIYHVTPGTLAGKLIQLEV